MSKHTPGPWEWFNNQTDKPFDFKAGYDGSNPSLRTVKEFGENKTEIRDGKSYTSWALPKFIIDAECPDTDAESVANFELVKLAPELFDACKAACDALEVLRRGHGVGVSAACYPALKMLREVLDKLRGDE